MHPTRKRRSVRVPYWPALFGLTVLPALTGSAAGIQSTDKTGEIPGLITISGTPRERGIQYGRANRDGIRGFLEREIYQAFIEKPSPKDRMLEYARACGEVVREVCPIIHEEMAGIAEGAGIRLEELTLITLHEELYHRGALPKVNHCTAVAVGPPVTGDGRTYVGQTWDWMESVYGLSSIVEWKRSEGPSVLAYGFPGLWTGAGLNSNGIALTWTSADLGNQAMGARVGLPSYVLLTHLLYQKDLESVIREAKRDRHAGWFTFVMADGKGNLLNIEGSPRGVVIERSRGRLVRVGFGAAEMTRTPTGESVKPHPRCEKMYGLLDAQAGKTSLRTLQSFFEDPSCGISVGKATIDMMVFDSTSRRAYLSRGPSYRVDWREFRFTR